MNLVLTGGSSAGGDGQGVQQQGPDKADGGNGGSSRGGQGGQQGDKPDGGIGDVEPYCVLCANAARVCIVMTVSDKDCYPEKAFPAQCATCKNPPLFQIKLRGKLLRIYF